MQSTSPSFCTGFATVRLDHCLVMLCSLLLAGCGCGITDGTIIDDDDDDATETTYTNEDCDNGIDDDGDGVTDCGDSDCADDAACQHECVVAEDISCGELLSANNGGVNHTDAIDSYSSCTTWDESGPEYTFRFEAATTEEVTASLTVAGHGNLDLFVLEDDGSCEGTDCIAYGASTVHWTANAGESYLIVVDGYAGGQDNFTLEILCPSGGGDGENCFNGLDDDGDGAVDCADLDCALDPYCLDEECGNNLDDDGDGYVDCDDTECWGDPICDDEDCDNGIDDNGNGLIDCEDAFCFGALGCDGEDCHDGIDNDGDFMADCDDPDCFGDSDCLDEICGNGADDDGDGLVDCDDSECFSQPDCDPENCVNGIDDDGDALVDCADPECNINPNCMGELCGNGIDDDGDGATDCDDTECIVDPACNQSCTATAVLTCTSGTVSGDTSTNPLAQDVITEYGCTPASETGNELVYSFTPTGSGEVTFVMDGLTGDMDLFGLQDISGGGCDPDDCLDSSTSGGTNSESITLTVTAFNTYYIAVDGWNDNEGPFTLTTTCTLTGAPEDCVNNFDDDGDSLTDCDDPDCAGVPGCTAEDCSDGIDNDGDGTVDCGDSDCATAPGCIGELCSNGIDDDSDGFIDCDDTECSFLPGCSSEDCTDNVDNDGDGFIDCDDADCTGNPVCNPSSGTPGAEDCTNGIDDDGDGVIDCDDLNCDLDPACGGAGGENCGNNIDDDGDGAIDCDDILCLFDLLCWFLDERCADGMDNDLDGAVDCADVDCATDPACLPESCNNGVDDDGDGFVDCADSECAMSPACVTEDCDNGGDEDGDGLVDCADPECAADPVCVPEDCSNGVDDDADGFTDCQDFDCWGNPVCTGAAENCSNDVDDNGDGLIDCADPTCSSDTACLPEICWNGTDDDGDLFADCDDDECFGDPNCGSEICWNNLDDDGDGQVDCDDDDCLSWPACDAEICDNNLDDDGDGDIDCDDIGCATFSGCTSEICDNNIDDDADGAVDCGDADCVGDPACIATSEQCNNGIDDDGDGQVDCDDSDCDGLPACAEDCTNGTDDDGDGDTDCDDSDCTGAPGCGTEDCTNDLDDDGDGWIDCGDLADCDFDPACIPEICGNGADDDGDGDIDCEDSECAGDDPACGEVCDNGVDDDGDGEIDCDDQADCAMDEDCESLVGGTCVEQVALNCGSSLSGTNWGMGSADAIDVYGCSSWIEDGPEYTYVFRPETTEQVTVCLSNESDETDIFIIEEAGGCDGNNCVEVATECATFDAVAGEQYYVVVDGYEGAMGSFDLDVTCPSTAEICDNGVDDDANGVADCDDAACAESLGCVEICQESWVLSCGSFDSFSTASPLATNQVDSYSCSAWEETGPEYAYYFQAPLDQANEVTIDLSYDWALVDLDIFVLEDQGIPCNSESCVSYGGLGTTFETEAGADYWVVVDGYQGDAGAYEVFVDCEPVPDAEVCDDGVDNDGDGDIDCDDEDCSGAQNCAAYCDENAPTISCEQTVSGDNTWDPSATIPGLTDSIDGYPCNIGSYTGPEMAYEWVATVTGTVEASFLSPQPTVLNHDIIVLDGDNGDCVNTQCVPDGQGFNDVEIEAVAGHTYYFVVDAFEGEEGPFQLHLDCSP